MLAGEWGGGQGIYPFVVSVDDGGREASLRLAGDSGWAAQLIMRAPELGVLSITIGGLWGGSVIMQPDLECALVTREALVTILANRKTGWSSLDCTTLLFMFS